MESQNHQIVIEDDNDEEFQDYESKILEQNKEAEKLPVKGDSQKRVPYDSADDAIKRQALKKNSEVKK